MSSPSNLIGFHDVAAQRGNRTIWDEGTFQIAQPSVTAIIGPNGSGKSTLLLMLLDLLEPSHGRIEVFGEPPAQARSQLGFVPQRYHVPGSDYLTVADYVRLGRTGARYGWGSPKDAGSRLDQALEAVQLIDKKRKRLGLLSGGEQQRAAIAQSLINQPRLLLMDEPFASLDVRHQQRMAELISNLRSTHSIGSLVVTHDLNPLLPYLDGVIYLVDGHAHYAPTDQAIDEELLTHLYGYPVQVIRTAHGDLFTRVSGTAK
jgi:zinc/manganese transport system ATP-binding protein